MELAEFLKARLDERERFIRRFAQLLNEVHLRSADTPEHQRASVAFVFGQEHLDPGFLLQEVAAKRAILADYAETKAALERSASRPGESAAHDYLDAERELCALKPVVRQLAAVWSEHPDYDPALAV